MTNAISYPLKAAARQSLTALGNILTKAETHAREQNLEDAVFLQARLYPDMFPTARQVQIACDIVARGASRLAGAEVISTPDTETSFAELVARCHNARDYILSLEDTALDASAGTMLDIPMGKDTLVPMEARQYLTSFILPNMYFHVTTAYALLRHQGVVLGKRDFLSVS